MEYRRNEVLAPVAPAKPKGMSEEQKNRLRGYMDEMKKNKGDCVVCATAKLRGKLPNKAHDFFTTPDVVDGHVELCLYGVCTGHTMLSNSDSLMEKAVQELKTSAKTEKPAKVSLLIVTYNVDSEELKYA